LDRFPFANSAYTFEIYRPEIDMKKVIVGVTVAAVILGGFLWNKQRQHEAALDVVRPHVKNTSIRVGNSVRLEVESTKVTYKELFDKLEADVSEIEKHVIEVQSLSTPSTAELIGPSVKYMQDAQDFSRALLMKYRKTLALSNALESYREAISEMRSSSSYSFEYASRRAAKAREETDELQKAVDTAEADLVSTSARLKSSRLPVFKILGDDSVVPAKQLDGVIAKNTPTLGVKKN
jgi:hypothetical protein